MAKRYVKESTSYSLSGKIPRNPSIAPSIILIIKFHRINIQYSVRLARPLKTAYLLNCMKYQCIIPVLLVLCVPVSMTFIALIGFGVGSGSGSGSGAADTGVASSTISVLVLQWIQKLESCGSALPHFLQCIIHLPIVRLLPPLYQPLIIGAW